MTLRQIIWVTLLFAFTSGANAALDTEFGRQPTWQPSNAQAIEQLMLKALEELDVSTDQRARANRIWEERLSAEEDLLTAFLAAMAEVDPAAADLLRRFSLPLDTSAMQDSSWLEDDAMPRDMKINLRLVAGRALIQSSRYEDGLALLEGIQPDDVIDPATLLFYRAVAQHQLLRQEKAIETLSRLLEREADLPRRYAALAPRMLSELESLKDDSLNHISRRMGDIRRRLGLGHAGPKVRLVEDGVIASLDKLIEDLEKQQQGSPSPSPSDGGGGSRSGTPAQDSMPLGGKGPGRVDKKELGSGRGWGALDPKERDEVLQRVGEDFPAHYREAIQEYFRKLAETRE